MSKPQVSVLMKVLRELLHAQGIRQRDIAERLHAGERTVRRWLSSDEIGVARIEKLCGLLNISFFELCELAATRVEDRITRLTASQEQALVDDGLLTFVFRQVLKGWTTEEIRFDLELSEPELVDALVRLEKLGLIELMPRNQVRLRTVRNIEWAPRGPYSISVNRWLQRCFEGADIGEPGSVWAYDEIKLSAGSVAQLRPKFDRLLEDVRELGDLDRHYNSNGRDWYACILSIRPMDVPTYPKWPAPSRPRRSPAAASTARAAMSKSR